MYRLRASTSYKSYRENKEQWENEFEKRYLTWLMQRAGGNISRAAREADMDRKYSTSSSRSTRS